MVHNRPANGASAGRPRPVRFYALDGLRMVCCIAVVVCHSMQDDRIGEFALSTFLHNLGLMGVDLFFALSGFLITRLLLDEIDSFGRASLFNFYGRRAVRIWPVYFVALALGFGLSFVLGERFTRPMAAPYSIDLFTRALPHYAIFLANTCPMVVPTALGVLWSVSIEEQFYAVFPPLFAASRRRMPALLPVVAGLALAWGVRSWLVLHGASLRELSKHPSESADPLLLGALLAQVSHRSATFVSFVRRFGGVAEGLAVGGLLAFTCLTRLSLTTSPSWRIAHNGVNGLLCAGVVGALAFGQGPLARSLSRPAPRALGTLTYATYVFHVYALAVAWAFCRRLGLPLVPEVVARSTLAVGLAFGLGHASKRLIEAPASRWRVRFTREAPDHRAIRKTGCGTRPNVIPPDEIRGVFIAIGAPLAATSRDLRSSR